MVTQASPPPRAALSIESAGGARGENASRADFKRTLEAASNADSAGEESDLPTVAATAARPSETTLRGLAAAFGASSAGEDDAAPLEGQAGENSGERAADGEPASARRVSEAAPQAGREGAADAGAEAAKDVARSSTAAGDAAPETALVEIVDAASSKSEAAETHARGETETAAADESSEQRGRAVETSREAPPAEAPGRSTEAVEAPRARPPKPSAARASESDAARGEGGGERSSPPFEPRRSGDREEAPSDLNKTVYEHPRAAAVGPEPSPQPMLPSASAPPPAAPSDGSPNFGLAAVAGVADDNPAAADRPPPGPRLADSGTTGEAEPEIRAAEFTLRADNGRAASQPAFAPSPVGARSTGFPQPEERRLKVAEKAARDSSASSPSEHGRGATDGESPAAASASGKGVPAPRADERTAADPFSRNAGDGQASPPPSASRPPGPSEASSAGGAETRSSGEAAVGRSSAPAAASSGAAPSSNRASGESEPRPAAEAVREPRVESSQFERREDSSRLRLVIRDDQLGRVSLRVFERGGLLQAMLRADSPRSAELLRAGLPAFFEQLSQRGFAAEGAALGSSPQQQEPGGDAERRRRGPQPEAGSRGRKRAAAARFETHLN